MPTSPRAPRFILAASILVVAAASTASAAIYTWQTAGTTNTWSASAGDTNWFVDPDTTTLTQWTDGNDASFTASPGETVTLSGSLAPATTTVSAGNWVFNGSGNLGGALTKSGTGELSLENTTANTFSSVALNGGFLRIKSNNNALGSAAITVGGNSTLATQLGSSAVTLANNISIGTGFTLSVDPGYADLTLNGAISGAGALTKTSSGNLTLGGANTYTGATSVSNGALTFAGTSSLAAATASTSTTVNGVLNLNSNNTLNFAVGTGTATVTAGSSGNGAINQTSGTVNMGASGGAVYLTLGTGTAAAYGSYNLSGGTLTLTNGDGVRVGYQGLGSFVQSGGSLSSGRWFSIGGSGATGNGVATFTGGTATVASAQQFLISDAAGSTGVMNVGTLAGGNAQLTTTNTNGIYLINGASGAGNATLNLNPGLITLSAAIKQANSTTGKATLNLNGGTLKAGAATTALIASTNGLVGNMYNGGLIVDTNGNSANIAANLVATTGNGVYAGGSAGVLANSGAQGSGYIGAPLVAVSGGTGTGATAIANISGGKVTGVTLTSPGQGYTVGDTLTFTLSGGGASTSIASFGYTLTASDIAANTTGGLTKNGLGTLTLSGANTYTGDTTIAAGGLSLADNAQLKFVIGANGVSNKISGTGSLTLDGDFNFDLATAATTFGSSWQIVNNGTLTETYSPTFSVLGFTDNLNNTWSRVNNGVTYTFDEGSGALSVTAVPEPGSVISLIGGLGMLVGLRRRRS